MHSSSIYQTRYQRQLLLKEWGPAAQEKLSRARILVIGAGGLGCPALQYLCAAGAGVLGIVDGDTVSLPDLHRQILYSPRDEGALKAERAADALRLQNPSVGIVPYPLRLTNENALDIFSGYDIIIDASDNFGTRYMVNDACALMGKPLVYGSVSRFEGQVSVFHWKGRPVGYRDLFPVPPAAGEVPSCDEAGVLGVLPGIIGSMQALEALKLATGIGEPLAGKLLTYQALHNLFYEVDIVPGEGAASGPSSLESFFKWPYTDGCSRLAEAPPAPELAFTPVDAVAFNKLVGIENILIMDVREPGEEPAIDAFAHVQYPLSLLREHTAPYKGQTIVVFCRTGVRSREAATILGKENTVYQLEGGILSWLAHQNHPHVDA